MPIIKARKKIEMRPATYRIESDLPDLLVAYSSFTNVPAAEIVSRAIRHVIESDQTFMNGRKAEAKEGMPASGLQKVHKAS